MKRQLNQKKTSKSEMETSVKLFEKELKDITPGEIKMIIKTKGRRK